MAIGAPVSGTPGLTTIPTRETPRDVYRKNVTTLISVR
jgi:hypothetical protein